MIMPAPNRFERGSLLAAPLAAALAAALAAGCADTSEAASAPKVSESGPAASASGVSSSGDFPGTALPLRTDLVVGFYQSGFAGETGREWTVGRSGTILGTPPGAPGSRAATQVASLSASQTSRLAEQFEQSGWNSLPATLGREAPVNGARIRMAYAGHAVQMLVPPGATDAAALRQLLANTEDARERAFLQLAIAVLTLLPR